MAKSRKSKGTSVNLIGKGITDQLWALYKEMEITREEANNVMKTVIQKHANIIQNEINSVLEQHIETGETIEHAIIPKVEVKEMKDGYLAYADVGVTLSENLDDMKHGNGGYGALLLDYGTPKKRIQNNKKRKYKRDPTIPVKPRFIGNAVRRGQKRCREEGQEIYEKILKEHLGK